MAHLKTQETHNNPSERKAWKLQLAKLLYERGYGEQDILELNNFLDWMMNLPEELEREFQAELKAFEEAKQMKYVTTIERMAEARAKEEQKQAIALNLLRQGTLSIEAISQATGLTIEQVQQLQTANP
jgi:predicted transposase YdaD